MRHKYGFIGALVIVLMVVSYSYDSSGRCDVWGIGDEGEILKSTEELLGTDLGELVGDEEWISDTSGCSEKLSRFRDLGVLSSRFRVNCRRASIYVPREKQEELLKEIDGLLRGVNETSCRDYENIRIYYSDLALYVEVSEIEEDAYGPYHSFVRFHVLEVLKGECLAKVISLGDTITFGLFSGAGYKVASEPEFKVGSKYIILSWRRDYNSLISEYFGMEVKECLSTILFPRVKVYELNGDTAVNMNCPEEKQNIDELIAKIRMAEKLTDNIIASYIPTSQLTIEQMTFLAPMVIRGRVEGVNVKRSESIVTISVARYYKNKWNIYPEEIKVRINKGYSGMAFPEDPDFSKGEEVIVFLSKALFEEGNPYKLPQMFGVIFSRRGKYILQDNIAKNTFAGDEIEIGELEARIMGVAEVDKR